MLWDVFISHASEDKITVARPLAQQLTAIGLRVWLDEAQLRVGDSLREKIDEGLAQSRFGVVILSPAFFHKRWPQRELAGLFARVGADVGGILPVWHGLSADEVATVSPMLADTVAASTSNGTQAVAEKIAEVVAPFLRPTLRDVPLAYSADICFPYEAVSQAVDVLESLAEPAIWRHLKITAEDYPECGWLGSDSSTIIEVIYRFAAPLFLGRALSYAARRNVALLDRASRLRLVLLNAAVDVFLEESVLASTPPTIPYSPRVPNWRAKRLDEPARYWWQGLSPERFDDARSLFLRPSASAGELVRLVSPAEFHDTYRALFGERFSDRKQQQTLGLLGNGFFGFMPRCRPVLWRVIVCQSRLYQAALGNMMFDPAKSPRSDVYKVLIPRDTTTFPFCAPPLEDRECFEGFATTMEATTDYLNTFVIPRLSATLDTPQE